MSMKKLACGTAFAALVCATSGAAYAQQTTGAVHGVVTSGKSPVRSATVTVTHVPTASKTVTVSNAEGAFDARGLRVGGPYSITIAAPGFEARTLNNIYVTVGDTASADVDLAESVAEVEEIVVTGNILKDSEQGPKTVLGRDTIESVVSINRDIRDLARRDMLVSQNIRNDGGISIAGSNPRTNRITIDGVTAQDPYGLETGGLPTSRGPISLDAVEQFSIAAVPTDVENGNFTGGALNMVLRSGTNTPHGSLFFNYLNDGMVGRKIGSTKVTQAISQTNYGLFLAGPIWTDRAFFALSYENYQSADTTQTGFAGEGFATSLTGGLTRTVFNQVRDIYDNGYQSNRDFGDIVRTEPVLDKKYSVKLDWNVTDDQRLSFTYRNAESSFVSRTDLSNSAAPPSPVTGTAASAAPDSHWYESSYRDIGYTLELNSKWTNNFSTTVRATYRDWKKGQAPADGANFSDVLVCSAPTADAGPTDASVLGCANGFGYVRFGPDLNRHANELAVAEQQLSVVGNYTLGDNQFKFGYQGSYKDVFNVFLPNSDGTYYFDSIADFNAGRANALIYRNAVSGNPIDAAALFQYYTHSLFAQDNLRITDNFQVTVGARYDFLQMSDKPALNPNFVARNGFTNQSTIDGKSILMPRISANWDVNDKIKISFGGGLFSGGYPEVLFATPFYNTGYVDTTVTIVRCAAVTAACPGGFRETSNTPGFTAAVGSAALNGLNGDPNFGYAIPSLVRQYHQGALTPGGAQIPAANEVIVLAPTFEIPGEWKAFISGSWEVWDGWRLNADVVATRAHNAITFVDRRSQPLVVNGVLQRTPDGRPRYDGLSATAAQRAAAGITSTNPGPNRDLVAQNTDEGESWTAAIAVQKSWDFGLDLGFGYATGEITESNSGLRFGTTASSLYRDVPAGFDPAFDLVGRGLEEISNRYKIETGYRKKFFGDNETRITLFGERTTGRPYGFYMQDAAGGRSPVFGVSRNYQMLYVPDLTSYSAGNTNLDFGAVRFANVAERDRFVGYVNQFGIPQNGLLGKYTRRNKDLNRLDLQISQELPSYFKGHKFKIQVDIRNVLNLINNDWGKVSEYFDATKLVSVACADAAGAAVPTTSAACPRYLYSSVPTTISQSTNTQQSLWYAQVSLRYEF